MDQLLITGNFNFSKIDWNNDYVFRGSNSKQTKFFNTCEVEILQQHVNELTRAWGDDTPSFFNLVFTKNPF